MDKIMIRFKLGDDVWIKETCNLKCVHIIGPLRVTGIQIDIQECIVEPMVMITAETTGKDHKIKKEKQQKVFMTREQATEAGWKE
jgi:hypothetical protein